MVKRRKISRRKKLVIELDKTFSWYIRARDNNICFTCHTTENPTCGHLFTRSCHSVRWDERNAMCQCLGCNFRHEFDPHIFTNAYINQFGLVQYQKLYALHARPANFSLQDLERLLEKYKKLLKEI